MDALSLLREFTIAQKAVVAEDGMLVFGDRACPRDTPTNFVSTRKAPYTIETLWYLAENVKLDHGKYLLAANRAGVPAVSRVDRRDVLAYITGETDSSAKLDDKMVVPIVERRVAEKRPAEEEELGANKRARVGEPASMQEDKDRLAKKTVASAATVAMADMQPLNNELTAEKLAEIRAKRLAKKRTTIASGAAGRDPSSFMKSDVGVTREIVSRERVHETRVSILRSRKPFDSVLQLLQSTKKQEAKERAQKARSKEGRQDYDRYNQPAQMERAGEEFGINVFGSHVSTLNKATAAKKKRESPKPQKKQRKSKTPIIIVPAGTKSMISIYNVKKLLEDGQFQSSHEAMSSQPNKPDRLIVNRRFGARLLPYRVIDNTSSMSKEQWERVIAVFVAGPAWQFKGWPQLKKGGTPVDVFAQVRGFHIKYGGDKLPKNISDWDIHILELSRSKRHLDPTAVRSFWDTLDAFTRVHRPELKL